MAALVVIAHRSCLRVIRLVLMDPNTADFDNPQLFFHGLRLHKIKKLLDKLFQKRQGGISR